MDDNIAVDGDIHWDFKKFPEDIKHFKETTSNHVVCMGMKTFKTLGRPLPNRVNIVLTSKKDFICKDVIVVHSIQGMLEQAYKHSLMLLKRDIFIIGGCSLYKAITLITDQIIHTRIKVSFDISDIQQPLKYSYNSEHFTKYKSKNYPSLDIEYLRRNA